MEQRTKFKKKINTNRGITLIALVITIIILLILAGISIAMLTGENGILTKASKAKEESKKAEYQEEIQLIITEKKIEKTTNLEETRTLIELVAEGIRQKEWQKSVTICDEDGNDNIKPAEGCKIIVETKDGYEIIVKIDNENMTGEIESITKGTGKTWKVTFDKNKGEGKEPEAIEKRQGFSILLPDGKTLSRTGYKFVGWSEDKDAKEKDETIYAEGSVYRPVEDTTLYAIWSEISIKINFNANTGEGNMDSINVLPGNSTKLTKNGYTKDGYRFKEWNTKSDGTGTKYEDEVTIENITEDMTLYAIWEEEIFATLMVTENKFTEGTKITFGGQAIASGIQKIELKVGNTILYTEEVFGDTSYSKSNLELTNLNQIALENLDFYDITVEMLVTSTTGNIGNRYVNVKNYTIGNVNALNKFAEVINSGNNLSGETIIQLKDITTGNLYIPIGYWSATTEGIAGIETSLVFSGCYDGKGKNIYISGTAPIARNRGSGVFGAIRNATIKNLTVSGLSTDGDGWGGVVGCAYTSTITDCIYQGENVIPRTGEQRGGIVGSAYQCKIIRCSNKTNIYGSCLIGGIVGSIWGDNIEINECCNLGNVTSNGKDQYGNSHTGGIAGNFTPGYKVARMINCYNTGTISGSYTNIAGLFGTCSNLYVEGNGSGRIRIDNCYNAGSVSGPGAIDPLHAYCNRADYYNSYGTFGRNKLLLGWLYAR